MQAYTKDQNIFFLKVVMLHIKLIGIEHMQTHILSGP